jgi:hypothetical protein
VPQVERHHLVDPEPEVGAQQVDGYRVPVRAADLLDAIPLLDRKGTQAEIDGEIGFAKEVMGVHARREHRVIRIAPLVMAPLLGGPDGQAAGPEPLSQVGHRGRERLVGHRYRGHDCVPLMCRGCGETSTYWPSGHDATVGVAATAARPAAVMILLVSLQWLLGR